MSGNEVPVQFFLEQGVFTEQDIEEDFPEDRADADGFTFYFFATAHPLAIILTVLHLILHDVPILSFIMSLVVSFHLRNPRGGV